MIYLSEKSLLCFCYLDLDKSYDIEMFKKKLKRVFYGCTQQFKIENKF